MSEKSNLEIEVADKESNEETEKSFEELGLDSRLIRALSKKGVTNPTPIQRSSIPLILVILNSLLIFTKIFVILIVIVIVYVFLFFFSSFVNCFGKFWF